MLSTNDFYGLLKKFVAGTLSAAEHDAFFEAVRSGAYDAVLLGHIEAQLQTNEAGEPALPAYRSEEIIRNIMATEKRAAQLMPRPVARLRWLKATVAAAVLVAVVAVSALWKNQPKEQVFQTPIAVLKNEVVRTNTSMQPLALGLEDGSKVLLQPGATLRYPRTFEAQKREVFLEGAAFFEVAKQSGHPFLVYAKNIVTRVLGTSFNVRTDMEKHELEVAVRTGRVQVYERDAVGKNDHSRNGVLLLPNQKVVYKEDNRSFVASLVDMPLPVKEEAVVKADVPKELYEEAALSTVLATLESRYGIVIMVENEGIYKCLFTGDISQQNLFTKLDIICKTLNASYEVLGTKILIRGAGCL